jgi:branched-chain amino acid transport system permease protein
MSRNNLLSSKASICAVVAALLLALPLVLQRNVYSFEVARLIMIYIILALGVRLTLLMGFPTLGHGSFALIGAYVSALLVMKLHVSFWFALPLSGAAAVIVGVPICYPSLMRLKGGYFLVVTVAFSSLLELVCLRFSSLTGGEEGLSNIPKVDPISVPLFGTIDFGSRFAFYYLVLFITVLVIIFMYRLDNSSFGRLIKATRQSDSLSKCVGVNVAKIRVITFAVACFSGGIAGSLFAHGGQYISPNQFGVWPSLYILLFVVFGGTDNVLGPILGTIILRIVPELLVSSPMASPIIFGVLLLFVAHFFPEGVLGIRRQVSSFIKTILAGDESSAQSDT